MDFVTVDLQPVINCFIKGVTYGLLLGFVCFLSGYGVNAIKNLFTRLI